MQEILFHWRKSQSTEFLSAVDACIASYSALTKRLKVLKSAEKSILLLARPIFPRLFQFLPEFK